MLCAVLRFLYECNVNQSFRRTLSVCVFLCALLLVAACQADPPTLTAPTRGDAPTARGNSSATPEARTNATAAAPSRNAPTAVPSPTVPPRGGSIVVAGVGAPTTEITALPDFVANALYDSLLRVNPQDGALMPGLAERWLVSDDAKTIVFILREGVKWHDGQPLTADDVAFTLKALSDPNIRINPAADFGTLEQVTAPDARTVSVTFRAPYCAALTYIGSLKILPQHLLQNEALSNLAPEKLIGTGPLILQTWQDNTLTFQANPAYWNGAPWITQWTYRAYPDERAANDALRHGQADVALTRTPISGAQNAPAAVNAFYALAFNTQRAPLDDVRVRQALAAALDRAPLAADARGVPLETSLLPAFWANPGNITQPKFDAARARQLLSDAGWHDADKDGILDKDGKPFTVTLWAQSDDPLAMDTAQRVRAQLHDVGAQAVLKLAERTLDLTRVFLQEFDLAIVHFNIPLDPDQNYFWTTAEAKPGYGLNVTGYTNAEVDRAIAAGNSVAQCAPDARKKAYAPVWQQLATDAPMVFLFAPMQTLDTAPRVRGLMPSPFAGAFWNLNAWSVAP